MPQTRRIDFTNQDGERLAAALTLPDHVPTAYALFAHCFTCSKNIAAASRISRFLVAQGYAVLRFDFTGIGNSEGDFANTNFASNIEDLYAAAAYLREHYEGPSLLVGHSLGGTAVLAAAVQIQECRAVATIGSPLSPQHLVQRLGARGANLSVTIGSERVALDPDFVHQYDESAMLAAARSLRLPLMVMHAPLDDVVPVSEASQIFAAAMHPKSFLSLDDADHLLSEKKDAEYVANAIAVWSSRYIGKRGEAQVNQTPGGAVRVGEGDKRFLRQVASDDHAWVADEPKKMGGSNFGPDPYEHLLAALGTCTSMTIRMYANRKKWPLDDVDILLTHSREHVSDCEHCEEESARVDVLAREIHLQGDLSTEQRARLLEIADRCPVHRTLEGPIRIVTRPA